MPGYEIVGLRCGLTGYRSYRVTEEIAPATADFLPIADDVDPVYRESLKHEIEERVRLEYENTKLEALLALSWNATEGSALPWENLTDSQMKLLEARRIGNPADVERARERMNVHERECSLLGTLLFVMAIQDGSKPLREVISQAFGLDASVAYDLAKLAVQRGTESLSLGQSLRDRIQDLDRRVDDVTPGVGVPERDALLMGELSKKVLNLAQRVIALERKGKS